MDSFLEHSAIELNEALNNPQEYYMTDDTKMPTSIYAAFDIDGDKYIMSLEATSDAGVYILEVGKTGSSGGKTYWWKFHKANHILPVLATALHFVQSATAWLGPKMKGIAVQFKQGASDQMDRAMRLATRIIKRSYVKSFTVVPVAQPAITDKDKYYHQKIRYLFIAKKNVPLTTLFGGKTFKKYDFDGKEAPAEAMAELAPKKMKKQVNTVKPSTKYSFGEFEIDTPEDTETLDKVKNLKPVASNDTQPAPTSGSDESDIYNTWGYGSNAMAGIIQMFSPFSSMVSALQKYGYDENKLDWGNLRYRINQLSAVEKEALKKMELFDVDSTNVRNRWSAVMKKIAEPSKSETIKNIVTSAQNNVKDFIQKYDGKISSSGTSSAPKSTTSSKKSDIDPTNIVATMPGSGIVVSFEGSGWKEEDGSSMKKKEHILYNLGYEQDVANLKTYSNVVSYSGAHYSTYNKPLRNIIGKLFNGEQLDKKEIKEITSSYSKYQKLFKAFNDIKPLPESLWVYRGTYIPPADKAKIEPGYEFVDPAFLSTSLKSDISFGKDKMRIFLPKGSKVVPILNHSKHSSENEILLPPSSVIKVVETEVVNDRLGIHGVFMGSAFKSITQMLKKQLTMAEDYDSINQLKGFIAMYEEDEKQEKYNPNDKFGGEYDAELADLIRDAIAKGKVKVEAPNEE